MSLVNQSANGHAGRRPEESNPETEVGAQDPPHSRLPKPTPVAPPSRKLGIALATTSIAGEVRRVEQLTVRELKGPGQLFTADLTRGVQLPGLAYKTDGGFSTHYQVLTEHVLQNPQVKRRAVTLAFIPAFAWPTCEVVLMPIKLDSNGQNVISGLQILQTRFPEYKAYIQWEKARNRHVLYEMELGADEAERLGSVKWPDEAAVTAVLVGIAFDSIEDLRRANSDIHTAMTAREVK